MINSSPKGYNGESFTSVTVIVTLVIALNAGVPLSTATTAKVYSLLISKSSSPATCIMPSVGPILNGIIMDTLFAIKYVTVPLTPLSPSSASMSLGDGGTRNRAEAKQRNWGRESAILWDHPGVHEVVKCGDSVHIIDLYCY